MSNAPTNSGGGHVARRSGVSRDRPRQSLLPQQACGFGIGGERRARAPQRHLVPGAWALLQRATRPRTSRPLRRRPLLLFYPCRKGRGTPQNKASQSGITLESWTQPSRVPSAEHAQNGAALAHPGVRKAGEAEPASSPGRGPAALTSQGSRLSRAVMLEPPLPLSGGANEKAGSPLSGIFYKRMLFRVPLFGC